MWIALKFCGMRRRGGDACRLEGRGWVFEGWQGVRDAWSRRSGDGGCAATWDWICRHESHRVVQSDFWRRLREEPIEVAYILYRMVQGFSTIGCMLQGSPAQPYELVPLILVPSALTLHA